MARINKFKEITNPNGMKEIVPDGYILMTEEELEIEALLNGDNSMTVALMNAEKQEIRAKYRIRKDTLDWNSRKEFQNLIWGFGLATGMMAFMSWATGHQVAAFLTGFCGIVGLVAIAINLASYIWQANNLNEEYDARMNEVRAKYF